MDAVEIGDIVGWRFSLLDKDLDAEHHGEVVAIHGDWLALRALSVIHAYYDPFLSRRKQHCHFISKKAV